MRWLMNTARNFFVRRKNNKLDSFEIGRLLFLVYFPEVIKRMALRNAFLIIDDTPLSLPLR